MREIATHRRKSTTKDELDAVTIGGARLLGGPVQVAEYNPNWPSLYAREAERIERMVGKSAIRIEHVGSTSVPGLVAKPIIDIVMEVADSNHEAA